jgi:hypothetical protein
VLNSSTCHACDLPSLKDDPSVTGLLLGPDGRLCKPEFGEVDLPVGLYGAGVARVDGGFVVCGGRQRADKRKPERTVNKRVE